jgi:hypothetical protein
VRECVVYVVLSARTYILCDALNVCCEGVVCVVRFVCGVCSECHLRVHRTHMCETVTHACAVCAVYMCALSVRLV